MDRNMEEIRLDGEEIHACAGALLSSVAVAARNASLTGFEFAGGIPGTIGGAAVMNAGAYGGELKDVLKEVTVMTREGEILTILRINWKWDIGPASSRQPDILCLRL